MSAFAGGTEVGGAFIKIGADDNDWDKSNRKIRHDLDGIGSKVGGMGPAAAGAGAGFAAMAGPLGLIVAAAAAAAAAVAAIGVAAWKAVSAYAELADTISILKKVSGTYAEEQIKHAQQMADAYGTARQKLLAFDQDITSTLKGVGASQEAAAKTSMILGDLAADLNSVKATWGLEGAMDAVKDVVAGEYETIKKYVTGMSAAAVEAKALEMGFAKVNGQFSNGAKSAAGIALLIEKSKDMSGDLADTQNETNNQINKIKGNFSNLMEDLGKEMEPAVKRILQTLNEWLPTIGKIALVVANGIGSGLEKASSEMEKIGHFSRNWEESIEIVEIRIREWILNIPSHIEAGAENFRNFANWLKENWLTAIQDVFKGATTYVGNFFENAVNAGSSFQKWMETGKFEFKIKSPLEGFEAQSKELPKLVRPHLLSLEKEVEDVNKRIEEKERKRREQLEKDKQEKIKSTFKLEDLYKDLKGKEEKEVKKIKLEVTEGGISLAKKMQQALMDVDKDKDAKAEKSAKESLEAQTQVAKNTEVSVELLRKISEKSLGGGVPTYA